MLTQSQTEKARMARSFWGFGIFHLHGIGDRVSRHGFWAMAGALVPVYAHA